MTEPARALTRSAWHARTGADTASAPVRVVHLGLSNFHRSHQAWYTAHAGDAAAWGIAAFTGRSPDVARLLAPQDGLYTLIERDGAGERAGVIGSIVEPADGADVPRFAALLAAPETAVVTITITEPGYRLTPAGEPDRSDPEVAADIARLRALVRGGSAPLAAAESRSGSGESAGSFGAALGASPLASLDASLSAADAPRTALGRLLLGLEARRRADAGPLAVVPCDNIPGNGPFVHGGLLALAQDVDTGLASWIDDTVSLVSTSVDRITPRTTPADIARAAELTGWDDHAPVVAETFTDWVLQGAFPAGRPAWQDAGARFVDDVEPFERRKLWLLNGAHSLLAYAGILRGYDTIRQAVADPQLASWVADVWAEAERHLPAEGLDLPAYEAALLRRFANPRIVHGTRQVGLEGVSKLRVRAVAMARAERDAGRSGAANARVIAAWAAVALRGELPPDAYQDAVRHAAAGPDAEAVRRLIAVLDEPLSADDMFVSLVEEFVAELR